MKCRGKIERKIIPFSFKGFLIISISCILFLTRCLEEQVNTDMPSSGLVKIQLHNFNVPLEGGSLEGSAPDIYYFKQKGDGSYVFMLTSTNYGVSQTNWTKEYVLVTANAAGVIQKTEVMKLPEKDGVIGTFGRVWDTYPPGLDIQSVGPNYVSDDKGILYHQAYMGCDCRNQFFSLQPETGQTEFFSTGGHTPYAQVFRTSDGGVLTIGGYRAPDYHKFSSVGKLEFKQPMRFGERNPAYIYLTDKNGDHYFVAAFKQVEDSWFFENTAKSFYNFGEASVFMPPVEIEIQFGPGKTQKAHRFSRSWFPGASPNWKFQDYIDVPFEVWDKTNNQQLMASFRDQGEDGSFNLVPLNVDWSNYFDFENPYNPSLNDPSQSQEWILGTYIPYSTTPDAVISAFGPFVGPSFLVQGYLAEGATWNPSALPLSSLLLKYGSTPAMQLLKVNANGSTVVKDNYSLGTVPFQNMFKAVPHLDGSAVLINVPDNDYSKPTTQLAILNSDFNQSTVLNLISNSADRSHQLESNKEKDRVFYARITINPKASADDSFKGSLLLSVIKANSIKAEKYLDEYIPYKLEKYRITPTKSGGVAIAAWVRPTKDTRDLLFFELDENLALVRN